MTELELRVITPYRSTSDELGRWLWTIGDTRERTKAMVADISQAEPDWTIPGVDN